MGVRGANWSEEHICGRVGNSDPEEWAQIFASYELRIGMPGMVSSVGLRTVGPSGAERNTTFEHRGIRCRHVIIVMGLRENRDARLQTWNEELLWFVDQFPMPMQTMQNMQTSIPS